MADYKDKRDEKTERRAVQKCDSEGAANNYGGNHSLSASSAQRLTPPKLVHTPASLIPPTSPEVDWRILMLRTRQNLKNAQFAVFVRMLCDRNHTQTSLMKTANMLAHLIRKTRGSTPPHLRQNHNPSVVEETQPWV